MEPARHHPEPDRASEATHRRPLAWLAIVLIAVAAVAAVAVRDATAWIGRPFAGFFVLDNRIVVSIGRSVWRDPALRRIEWTLVTAVDGTPIRAAGEIHDAVRAAGAGGTLTYTLRRGAELFRVAIPAAAFSAGDFATVFAPMLGVGVWTVAVGAALLVVRPRVATLRAAFVVCLALGLMLITGPDQYGPYRFVVLFYLALALMPAAVFHLTAAFVWWPGAWTRRVVAVVYVLCAGIGVVLVARRFDPAVFLPLLYIVYFALANALVLYIGTLVSALVNAERLRPHVALALTGVVAPAVVPIVVLVTYPLWTEPVSVPWFVLPIGLWPLLHGVALLRLSAERTPSVEAAA